MVPAVSLPIIIFLNIKVQLHKTKFANIVKYPFVDKYNEIKMKPKYSLLNWTMLKYF